MTTSKQDTRPDIPLGYTCDTNDNVLTYKNWYGFWYAYTRDTHGRELTYTSSSGVAWVALAHAPVYTLGYDAATRLYSAGCRSFTRKRALKHWGSPRKDNIERAALFHAAIINHKE
jgi:hypothetical protein